MNKIAVFGLGKVGTLVGILLSEQFSVIGYDIHPPYYEIELPFEYKILDIGKVNNIKHALEKVDVVVSALPYFLNKHIAEIAHRCCTRPRAPLSLGQLRERCSSAKSSVF